MSSIAVLAAISGALVVLGLTGLAVDHGHRGTWLMVVFAGVVYGGALLLALVLVLLSGRLP